jgi:hypothetical protein
MLKHFYDGCSSGYHAAAEFVRHRREELEAMQ